MANYTDITVLLDRSGSMAQIKPAMQKGFDELIRGHQTHPTTRISLAQFDSVQPFELIYTARPITDVPSLSLEPRGMTPLYDALCASIDATGRRLAAMQEGDRPNKVLFVIITDGEENNSMRHGQSDVKQRITHQTDKYNWQFVYLGANQNALLTAHEIGIDWKKAITFDPTHAYSQAAMASLVDNTVAYSSTGDEKSLNYSNAQRSRTKAIVRPEDLTIGDDPA